MVPESIRAKNPTETTPADQIALSNTCARNWWPVPTHRGMETNHRKAVLQGYTHAAQEGFHAFIDLGFCLGPSRDGTQKIIMPDHQVWIITEWKLRPVNL